MKKKGFTLIELLAVIVILAIIALIATPLVLKYIEKSRKESKVDSAYSFVRNLETEIANYSIKHNGKKYNGQPTDKGYYELTSFENSEIDTTVKGDKPDTIKVCLSSLGQVDKAILQYGKYYVSYDGKKGSISDSDTYNSFSCSTAVKIEVPEATKEINFLGMGNLGLISNDQGLVYYYENNGTLEDLESENNIYDINPSYVDFYKAPISLFKDSVPTDGNIEATIRFLDGSEKTIELVKTDDYWSYRSTEPMPYLMESSEGWYINFRPNTDVEGTLLDKKYSDEYHLFQTGTHMRTSHGLQSITILGTTLYFKSEVLNVFMAMDENTGDEVVFCDDFTKLNRVIVNYKDGTQNVFNITSDDINADGEVAVQTGNHIFLMRSSIEFYIRYKNPDFNYTDDIFKDIPKVSTITFEQEGNMTTYKMSDNPYTVYSGPGD